MSFFNIDWIFLFVFFATFSTSPLLPPSPIPKTNGVDAPAPDSMKVSR
jgi:hypothetical protein